MVDMFLAPFWLIWIQGRWIQFVQVNMVNCSDQTILCLVNQVLGTIGRRVITQKVKNYVKKSWMLFVRKQNQVMHYKVFNWFIHWVVVQDLVSELSS
jgi:hypothetical protein